MSEELALKTKDFVTKALKNAQDSHGPQGWCHREPKKWALTVQHIIQQPSTVSEFLNKNGITRNFYYDTRTELLADPECQEIRRAWGSEVASLMFESLDTHRTIMRKFSERVENDEIEIDENVAFKSVKSMQGLSDIHGKLTGNNVQKHVVEHVVTQEEFEDKRAKLEAKIEKAKEAKKVESDLIEVD